MLTKDDFVVGNVIAVPFAGRGDKAQIIDVVDGKVTFKIITEPDCGATETGTVGYYMNIANLFGGYVDQGETNAD